MQNENEKKNYTHLSPNLEGWSRESTNPAPPPRVVLALLLLLLKQD